MKKCIKGFSLIELIVVMAIVAILVLIAAPRYLNYTNEAREKQIVADVKLAGNKIAEYLIKSNDKLPIGSTSISASTLTSSIKEMKLYDINGLVSSIDETQNFSIIPITYVNRELGSKLKGSFISSEGGDVYYLDINYSDINISENRPLIQIKESENPDNMTAVIMYPSDSVVQEYKIDNSDWIPLNLSSQNIKDLLIQPVHATETNFKISVEIPNGSTIYARASYPDKKVYENSYNLKLPEILLSTLDQAYSVSADVKVPENVVTKEYRIGNSKWMPYNTAVIIDENISFSIRGKDIYGNIVAYNKLDITNIVSISWYGLEKVAFDKNQETSTNIDGGQSKIITWDGNLVNRVVYFDLMSSGYNAAYITSVFIRDASGTYMTFQDTNGNEMTVKSFYGSRLQFGLVIPEGAKSIVISNATTAGCTVYDIHEANDLNPTNPVTNLTATPDKTVITLNWSNPTDQDYKTVWIFRNGVKIGESITGTYTDNQLYANTSYTYKIVAVDTVGNLSDKSELLVKTLDREIYWSGLGAAAFDMNDTTSVSIGGYASSIITWVGNLSNRVVYFDLMPNGRNAAYITSVFIRDASGTYMTFQDTNGNEMTVKSFYGSRLQFGLVIPEGAKSIVISNATNASCTVYDIHE